MSTIQEVKQQILNLDMKQIESEEFQGFLKRLLVKEDKVEWVEFEVEYGYFLEPDSDDEDCHGEGRTDAPFRGGGGEADATEVFEELVKAGEYDYVDLVLRHMEGEDCMCSEAIREWKKNREDQSWNEN